MWRTLPPFSLQTVFGEKLVDSVLEKNEGFKKTLYTVQ